MKFYTKSNKLKVLDLLSADTKLRMNWELVSNGANINLVFKENPVGLEAFLREDTKVKVANKTTTRGVKRIREPDFGTW